MMILLLAGCSTAGDIVSTPMNDNAQALSSGGAHNLWGFFEFTADPVEKTLEVVPLRLAGQHINALPFLEPPPNSLLTLEDVYFNGNVIEVDIGIRHPFMGLTQFTGFDVRGILITDGTKTGISEDDLTTAGEEDTHLLNPDGHTRWWNPLEFAHTSTMNGYSDGLLGVPDAQAEYASNLNAYKIFADGLDPDADAIDEFGDGSDIVFSHGVKNIRHYSIKLGSDGLVFNYAIDASWKFPSGSPPWDIDDFPQGAKLPEAWGIGIEENVNTLWNDGEYSGGCLILTFDIYAHSPEGIQNVRLESPGHFDTIDGLLPTGGNDDYSTYQLEIMSVIPPEDMMDVLITVESDKTDYNGHLPGETVCAYFLHSADVGDQPGVNILELTLDAVRTTYNPLPDAVPQTLIDYIHLDWPEVNGAEEYAIYRADLYTLPYEWIEIETVAHPTSEYDNIRTGPYAINWNMDYIYEVRSRSIAGDAASEFLTTQQALVIMESDDSKILGNALWDWQWGAEDFQGSWSANPEGADEPPAESSAFFYWFASQVEDSWTIIFCPWEIPDIVGQSTSYIDFAFTKGPEAYTMPESTHGWAPGTMTATPIGGEDTFFAFDALPGTAHLMGAAYNPDFNEETFNIHFGEPSGAFCGSSYDPFFATRFAADGLLEDDVDYIGIGLAAFGTAVYKGYVCFDSIAVVVY